MKIATRSPTSTGGDAVTSADGIARPIASGCASTGAGSRKVDLNASVDPYMAYSAAAEKRAREDLTGGGVSAPPELVSR